MSGGCKRCRTDEVFPVPFSMAFQPIVDIAANRVFGHEALVRGPNGEGAPSVLGAVDAENRYAFDQSCRVKAIELAARLFPPGTDMRLSINFLPNAVYEPRACIRRTLEAAERVGFPLANIVFEFTEDEKLDVEHVLGILEAYRQIGFKTAIDDFGAGSAGLQLLTRFRPDIVKLDMALIRGIDADPARQIIVRNLLIMFAELGVTPLCEGIETEAELAILRDMGVKLIQGYYFARPSFEALTDWP